MIYSEPWNKFIIPNKIQIPNVKSYSKGFTIPLKATSLLRKTFIFHIDATNSSTIIAIAAPYNQTRG